MSSVISIQNDSTALIRYEATLTAIAECHRIDEIKDLHDKALALELYARQALNRDAERQAAEIRIRAERRAGQLLKGMKKAKGGRPTENTSRDGRSSQTLDDLGVSYNQFSRWQQIGDIPEAEFEDLLTADKSTIPTTAGLLYKVEKKKEKPEIPPATRKPTHEESALIELQDVGLQLWGEITGYERDGLLKRDPKTVLQTMRPLMQADMRRRRAGQPEAKRSGSHNAVSARGRSPYRIRWASLKKSP